MGIPSNKPIPPNTIRMTVQLEVPHSEEIMNYGNISKKTIVDYINSDKFQTYLVESGPRNYETQL